MDLSPRAPESALTSLALANLRGVFILILLAFHSTLAYLASTPGPATSFESPPFTWLSFPIVDQRRFFGFDLFCAWEDVQVMAMMFFLSGLFVPASLRRKGPLRFLADRALRLGAPFVFGVLVLMPLALFPAFHRLNPDADLSAYLTAYRNLPFVPDGPQWFLWLLMAFSLAAAALAAFAPGALPAVSRGSAPANRRPAIFLAALAAAATLAYVPLALAFGAFPWFQGGPISFQESRPLLYGVFFFAGAVVGETRLGEGLLAPDGVLATGWRRLAALSLGMLFLWMGLTGAGLAWPHFAPIALRLLSALAYVGASVAGVMFLLAASVRFLARPIRWLETLSRNALGIFVFHFPPIVWLQYALLGAALPGLVKGGIVFCGALSAALALAIAIRRMGPLVVLIGETQARAVRPAPPPRAIQA